MSNALLINFLVGLFTWSFLNISSYMYKVKGGELGEKNLFLNIKDLILSIVFGWVMVFCLFTSLLDKGVRDFFIKAWT